MYTKLQFGRPVNFWGKGDNIFICITWERETGQKDKIEKVGKHESQHLCLLSHNIFGYSQSVNKFEDSGSHRSREIWLILFHTIQKDTQHLYQISNSQVQYFLRNLRHNFSFVLEWEMNKIKKEGKSNLTTLFFFFSFPQYIRPLSRCIQNLKMQAVIGAEKSDRTFD